MNIKYNYELFLDATDFVETLVHLPENVFYKNCFWQLFHLRPELYSNSGAVTEDNDTDPGGVSTDRHEIHHVGKQLQHLSSK